MLVAVRLPRQLSATGCSACHDVSARALHVVPQRGVLLLLLRLLRFDVRASFLVPWPIRIHTHPHTHTRTRRRGNCGRAITGGGKGVKVGRVPWGLLLESFHRTRVMHIPTCARLVWTWWIYVYICINMYVCMKLRKIFEIHKCAKYRRELSLNRSLGT